MNKCSGVSSIADFFTAIRRCRAHLVVVRMTTGLLCENTDTSSRRNLLNRREQWLTVQPRRKKHQKSPAAGTLRRFSHVSRG